MRDVRPKESLQKSEDDIFEHNYTESLSRSMRREPGQPIEFDLGPDLLNKTQPNIFDSEVERYSIIEEKVGGRGNVSNAWTYFNIIKCFIGIGILATPSAF